jgi:hypothetical protein
MDPLSVTTSIIAVIQLPGTILDYLNAVRKASKDQVKLAIEASNIYNLLISLRYRVEQASAEHPWFDAVRALRIERGPLDQPKAALEEIVVQIEPTSGIKKLGKTLTWKLEKRGIDALLSNIERVKLLVSVALANDLFSPFTSHQK